MAPSEGRLGSVSSAVQVAIRVRPQVPREKLQLCRICVAATPGEPEIVIGEDRRFTFDNVFDQLTNQRTVYEKCVESLIEGTFDGFNATVLAYGQTGSGKTYTMGTAIDVTSSVNESDIGIIPRAMQHLFDGIEARKSSARDMGLIEPMFDVAVQFIELYNENIVDLLIDDRTNSDPRIHEDSNGEIFIQGVASKTVTSPHETLEVLKNGALNRTTASTNMNEQSSRSHAIFTVLIKQQRVVSAGSKIENEDEVSGRGSLSGTASEFEVLTAKFHFVDLAGSERLKRTGATGDRAKEGISINCGLLALGNVIHALGETSGKITHIPYRDSKLTRLLQDSLGGNSRTLMIACVSPSDCDFVETLNTLKYANRAKEIKNKVIANQDKSSKLISGLRARILELEAELVDIKQGKITIGADGVETFNDQYQENIMLRVKISELEELRIRVKAIQETNEALKARNVQLLAEKQESFGSTKVADSTGSLIFYYLGDATNHDHGDIFSETIRGYLDELETLRSSLVESQSTNKHLRKQLNRLKNLSNSPRLDFNISANGFVQSGDHALNDHSFGGFEAPYSPTISVIEEAKADIEKMKKVFADGLHRKFSAAVSGELSECSSMGESFTTDVNPQMSPEGSDKECTVNGMTVSTDRETSDFDENSEEEDEEKDFEHGINCITELKTDLADLQTEISIKERLVMELERSEQRLTEVFYFLQNLLRLKLVRLTYEKKLAELSLKIAATEAERDRVLSEMATKSSAKLDAEHVKRIKDEYERKLKEMRSEFKKLQSVEREHRKMQARQAAEQQQLARLRSELADLKKTKVQLLQKIKEEVKRSKASELEHSKKVSNLERETRFVLKIFVALKKDNIIKQLENKERQRELYIKRTNEEVARLRQLARQEGRAKKVVNNSFQQSLRFGNQATNSKTNQPPNSARFKATLFSVKMAKQKWQAIEKYISRKIAQRQTFMKMEEELERRFGERYAVYDEIQDLEHRYTVTKNLEERDLIGEQIDGLQVKENYIQDQIVELQRAIVDVDNDKESDHGDYDANKLEDIIGRSVNISEIKYILQHLFVFSLERGFLAAKAESDKKESEARIQQLEQEKVINESLLSQVIEDKDIVGEVTQVLQAAKRNRDGNRSPEPADSTTETVRQNNAKAASQTASTPEKARRRTATADELLYSKENKAPESLDNVSEDNRTRSNTPEEELPVSPSTPRTSKKSAFQNCLYLLMHAYMGLCIFNECLWFNSVIVRDVCLRGKRIHVAGGISGSTLKQDETGYKLNSGRRQHLLSRLVPRWHTDYSPSALLNGKVGRIIAYTPRTATGQRDKTASSRLLVRTHTLDGHTKSVLSIAADETKLLTGSKDRLVKLWDLERGTEKCTLGLHPNNVFAVKFIPGTDLALSVSMATVRLWDLRTESCIRMLLSSGLAVEADSIPSNTSRQNTVPIAETVITAVELDPTGRSRTIFLLFFIEIELLFTSFAGDVRIWDLEKVAAYGRLISAPHGPRSEVSCLAVTNDRHPVVFTGSRDHYVKMYVVTSPNGEGMYEAYKEFLPPHYDNVTSVLPYDDSLFTASKDSNIMRFSLKDFKRDHLELKAHSKWILDMCLLQADVPILASVCKGGTVKLWDITTNRKIRLIEEVSGSC
uniref:Kinesin motor domain-containing protein n=1 Tax=Syphacia muris TaxID=451379 RepID=A0A0N5AWF0_9BILA